MYERFQGFQQYMLKRVFYLRYNSYSLYYAHGLFQRRTRRQMARKVTPVTGLNEQWRNIIQSILNDTPNCKPAIASTQRQTGTKRPLSPVHWSACDGAAESPGATLLLFLADRQTETEVLGQLVLRVQSVSEVDATHATVGVYLRDNTGLV